ncbi:MAG: tRNA (adenine-N1)-methyltransferase [Actinobacteria bacterium]|uniref:Unannotated protein n=1 Tax=freshwater metagenome TaxID=449393 RepID=A0A6J7DV16_9ZZZZ|nr:tRNA (adenine-N1)-methyltransferase [Actinomycetota bacterium]
MAEPTYTRRGAFAFGDLVQLTDTKGKLYTITLTPGKSFHTHRGAIEHDAIVGLEQGSVLMGSGGNAFLALKPLLDDFVLSMPRGAAVIYPKDSARIVGLTGLGPGSRVAEAGVGSGALTCSLLRAVGGTGHVYSYERREEFAAVAAKNVDRWFGMTPEHWTLTLGDLAHTLVQRDLDAVVLDMLAPWECLEAVAASLSPGGVLVGYVATTTQMSKLVEYMRVSGDWTEPRAEESLIRTWHLDGLAVRPDHRMIGHSGFLVAARRLAPGAVLPVRRRRPAPGAYGEDYSGPGATADTALSPAAEAEPG